MVQLALNQDECAVLTDMLQAEINELRHEIHDTDATPYKDELKERERVVKRLLSQLQALTVQT